MSEPLWADGAIIYCTLGYFETHYERSYQTVRQWITTGQARSRCFHGTLYVHMGDARALDRDLPRQTRVKQVR